MSHDFEEKLYQDITDVGGFAMAKAVKTWHHQELQKARESERERINQFFAVKADYDTDNDCVILTDKVYHQAFFPDGCGSDGQDGRNRCEDCYKYRTKFGQNVLAKLEPHQSELDQPTQTLDK